jgi:hypothetical protein
MRKPVVMVLPPVECMPFAHFYPVIWEEQAEAEAAPAAGIVADEPEAPKGVGFWERVLEAMALAWSPYGYIGM